MVGRPFRKEQGRRRPSAPFRAEGAYPLRLAAARPVAPASRVAIVKMPGPGLSPVAFPLPALLSTGGDYKRSVAAVARRGVGEARVLVVRGWPRGGAEENPLGWALGRRLRTA